LGRRGNFGRFRGPILTVEKEASVTAEKTRRGEKETSAATQRNTLREVRGKEEMNFRLGRKKNRQGIQGGERYSEYQRKKADQHKLRRNPCDNIEKEEGEDLFQKMPKGTKAWRPTILTAAGRGCQTPIPQKEERGKSAKKEDVRFPNRPTKEKGGQAGGN